MWGRHDFASGDTAACARRRINHEDLQTFLRYALMMTSLTDFYYHAAKDGWERELESKILDPAVAAKVLKAEEKQLQLSRLHMAWQSTSDAVVSQGNQDDPLPESVRQMLDQRWKSRYCDFTLEPALTPSSASIHRLYREWSPWPPVHCV